MSLRGWVLVGCLLAILLAWYLSYSASRLDRLHHRVEGARAVLDAQLIRRAEAAIDVATSGLLDPASGLLVAAAAAEALSVGEERPPGPDGRAVPDDDSSADRERAESDLTEALQVALGHHDQIIAERAGGAAGDPLERLASASHRVQLARRFHNQAVTDARRVRRKRVVRWAHLAGRAAMPQTFEIDDEPPSALSR